MSLISLPSFAEDLSKAYKAFDSGDYPTAIEEFKIFAEQGSADAQYMLGKIYEYHGGPDFIKAMKWYKLSAEQGDKYAQFSLGQLYERGNGVSQNYEEAIKWYQKSAEQEDELAQFSLGLMYFYGRGISYSSQNAFKHIRRSALNGFAPAQDYLGYMYSNGKGVRADKKKALQWYRVAFKNGHKEAKPEINKLIKNGYDAVPLCVKFCDKRFWRTVNRKNKLSELKNLDITQRTDRGESILHTASLFATSEELRALIDMGVDINVRSDDGRSALHTAAMSNNYENIKLLLKSGANPHARTKWGLTPLGYSDGFGFEILREYGADINARDINGYTRLHTWIDQTLEAMWGYWHSATTVKKYSFDDLSKFINSGIDLNAKTKEGLTALHLLIGSEAINFDAINLLISSGADLNLIDDEDNTPLYLAASLESEDAPELVEVLLLAGANANSVNEFRKTPWDAAEKNDYLIGTDAYWMLHDARF